MWGLLRRWRQRRDATADHVESLGDLKAEATEAMATGAWSRAVEARRRLRDRDGGTIATRYELAKALQRRCLVPFEVDDGAAVPVSTADREVAFEQAVRELEVVSTDAKRVRSTYFLGRHFEYGQRWAEAAATYRLALERLATTDAAWAHSARLAWEFRLAWVRRQLDEPPTTEPTVTAERGLSADSEPTAEPGLSAATGPRLARSAQPLAESSSTDDQRLSAEASAGPGLSADGEPTVKPGRSAVAESSSADEDGQSAATTAELAAAGRLAGYFDATVTDRGLSVSGFVLPGRPDTVDLHLDGRFAVSVTVDPRQPLRAFAITLTHPVLDEFGAQTVLTARCGDGSLATRRGTEAVVVAVPDGTGKFPVLLDAGHRLNKKGRLSPPDASTVDPQPAHFRAFAAVAEVFAELGRPLFLAYGTLLGCHRDGRLIPGDDDFDVAYLSHATDPQGVKDEAQDLMAALVRAGFDVRVAIDGRPFHLGAAGIGIDVNPLWQYRDRIYGYTGHALPRAAFARTVPLELGEYTVAVPVGVEAFLADTYGPDWRTPAPGFRYYRGDADLKTLRRARLRPSEVAALADRVAALRAEVAGAGRFGGYAAPDNPDFD